MTNPPSPNEALRSLRWYKPTDHPCDREDAIWMAMGYGGRYAIEEYPGHFCLWMADDEFTFKVGDTVDACKAIAEQHWQDQIAQLFKTPKERGEVNCWVPAALSPSPASSPVGGDDALLNTARRNIRTFINGASFKCSADKEAALACVDVLESNLSPPTPERDNQAIWDALRDFTLADGRTLESFFVKGNDKINFCCLIASLSPSSGEPASVAVEAVSGEVVDQLKLVNSWLCGLAELDMDEIVADGGITVAMVVQQEAEHQHKRLRSAIAALIANPFDGWQMVPVEITDAMLSATCCDECDDREMRQTWKELLYAAPKPPVSLSKPTPVEAKPWYETDAHRDLSRIIPDMEGKIADAKTRYAHCLPDHLFAPLEASITELRVLRHEVAAQPTPVEAGLVERLRIMAKQRPSTEMDEEDQERADWQGAYDWFCTESRAILAALSETPPPPSQEGGDGHD